jgi:SPP1 gp7 family putative phage head morphogenesis protein
VGLRSSYRVFNEALRSLYGRELLTLADSDRTVDFDDALFEDAAKVVYENGGFDASQLNRPQAQAVINETLRVLDTAIDSGLPHEVPEAIRYALENNAFIFSGFKTFHALREVGLSMVTEQGTVKPFNDFLNDVKQINALYNHNYLYAEYNHAVGASQMAAKWHDFEQDGDEYNLQYRTAGDDKVREDHAILNGTTLPASDPFWSMFLPPNGWNCRCTAVQVRKNKYPLSDPDLAMQRGRNCTDGVKREIFRYNAGKSLQLFPPGHPYYKAPAGAKQVIEQVTQEAIREKRIRDMIAELPDNLTVEEKTAIATHNLELEKALKVTKGKPMTVQQADKQHANPNHGKGREYNINCQTCTPAYVLRTRGFNVTAKPNTRGSKSEYLSRGANAWAIWKNPDGTQATHVSVNSWLVSKKYMKMTEKRWMEYFNETCKEVGIYGLCIGWKRGGGGHMTVLQRFPDGELRYIEPQHDNSKGSGRESYDLNFLAKYGSSTQSNCRGIMRIDNKLFNINFIEIFDK